MGWDFYCDKSWTKARIVADKVAGNDMRWDGHQATVIAHALRGNHLWRVVEKPDGSRFIALDLLRSGGRDSGWGYKGLCESVGPREVDCPLGFLDMVPPNDDYGWRDSVRAYHANKRARASVKLAPGMPVTIYGKAYTIIRKREPRGWIVRGQDGRIYRATRGIVPDVPQGEPFGAGFWPRENAA